MQLVSNHQFVVEGMEKILKMEPQMVDEYEVARPVTPDITYSDLVQGTFPF